MKLTRRGVCYDLSESPYTYEMNYNDNFITFYFSSEFNKERFINKLVSYRKYVNNSLSNRFGVTISVDEISDIKLYSTYEKRGFFIKVNNEEYTCLENLLLLGTTVIRIN